MTKEINDITAERAVLAGLVRHGSEAFIDVDDLVNVDSFTDDKHQILFACLKKVFEESTTVDLPSLFSAAKSIGLDGVFVDKVPSDYVKKLSSIYIAPENVRSQAKKLVKFTIGRELDRRALKVRSDIRDMTGDETVSQIINIGEAPFLELSSDLNNQVENKPVDMSEDIEEYIDHLINNPSESMGISSGFPRFDKSIGGGFRRKSVDLIAARPKTGKSMFADAVALHVAGKLGLPVLMLDTEMSKEDHVNRILANLSDIEINDIATGSFSKTKGREERVRQAAERIKEMPCDYVTIAGKSFEETISIMRRWVIKKVGCDDNGRTKPCLIIYDYLKLMHSDQMSGGMQEFQVLGFQMTTLVNFMIQYDAPCLSFVQLNRDGVTRESSDVISGSDRLVWLCASLTIFKRKSDEEIAEDGGQSGNRKLVPIAARHGGGLADEYDYINMNMMGEYGRIDEGFTKSEYILEQKRQKEGFDNEVSNEEEDFIVQEEVDMEKPF